MVVEDYALRRIQVIYTKKHLSNVHANKQETKVRNKPFSDNIKQRPMSLFEYDMPPTAAPYNTPPALIAFTLGVLVVCFVAFSIVYLCKYCFSSVIHTWAFQRTASGSLIRLTPHRSPPRGLDPSMLQLFPTFTYSSVKDLRKDQKYGLECAICLLEFEDDNMLRLLTLCCHVFHQECIDLWLRSHKTCPVCRRNLDSPPEEVQKTGDVNDTTMVTSTNGEIHINVGEEEQDGGEVEVCKHLHKAGSMASFTIGLGLHPHECEHNDMEIRQEVEQTFARSHSTGHSIVLIRGEGDEGKSSDDDKYTLRLPEHVLRVRQNKHNCTRSCVSYKDMTRFVTSEPCSNCGFVQPMPTGSSSPSHDKKS
ncbi:hypothetical protein VNO78_26990 [Psophocarpus tetragonolobus]|uniref:RING-type E3 ubiquitin transferase n=1 Tax=Psophocarpus tetragonolobus TaxID=3891 RepID=A0AAN9XAH3_PSOTE